MKEPYLKQQVSELEELNRELKETARIVVKESVATAEALHTNKIELIENQIHEWEEAIKTAESNIEIATQNLYTKTRDNRYQIR